MQPGDKSKKSRSCCFRLEESCQERGCSHWSQLSFEQVLILSPPWGKQKDSPGGDPTCVAPIGLASLLSVSCCKVGVSSYFIIKEDRWDVFSAEKTCTTVPSHGSAWETRRNAGRAGRSCQDSDDWWAPPSVTSEAQKSLWLSLPSWRAKAKDLATKLG